MKRDDEKIIEITPDVKWIGVLDYDIRTFDIVMTTEYGTTYNSYFINAGRKAVIEVGKEKFSDAYLKKLRSVTDPAEIQYIVLDHTEPDHSGSLAQMLKIAPAATVVGRQPVGVHPDLDQVRAGRVEHVLDCGSLAAGS